MRNAENRKLGSSGGKSDKTDKQMAQVYKLQYKTRSLKKGI